MPVSGRLSPVSSALTDQLCSTHRTFADFQSTALAALTDLNSRVRLRRKITVGDTRWLLAAGHTMSGQLRRLRPINMNLFTADPRTLTDNIIRLTRVLTRMRALRADRHEMQQARDSLLCSRTLYTVMQAIGCAMDLHLPSQQARKQAGTRFEDLVSVLFDALGADHREMSRSVVYEFEGIHGSYRPQLDRVLSPDPTGPELADSDIICSVKTSSKDRFTKIFSDRYVLETIRGRRTCAVAFFHNDVQRVGSDQVATTFVPHTFLAYVKAYGPLDGIYYLDPPPHHQTAPWQQFLRTFDDWVFRDAPLARRIHEL